MAVEHDSIYIDSFRIECDIWRNCVLPPKYGMQDAFVNKAPCGELIKSESARLCWKPNWTSWRFNLNAELLQIHTAPIFIQFPQVVYIPDFELISAACKFLYSRTQTDRKRAKTWSKPDTAVLMCLQVTHWYDEKSRVTERWANKSAASFLLCNFGREA